MFSLLIPPAKGPVAVTPPVNTRNYKFLVKREKLWDPHPQERERGWLYKKNQKYPAFPVDPQFENPVADAADLCLILRATEKIRKTRRGKLSEWIRKNGWDRKQRINVFRDGGGIGGEQ